MSSVQYVRAPDGTRLAYIVYGSGGAAPIVSLRPPQFSHLAAERDAGRSHHEYDEYGHGRRLLRFDPRGTGLSSRECAQMSLSVHVADLERVLAAAGLDRVVLDAISSSALVAFEFAARNPERVDRIVVQNAFVDGAAWWSNPVRRALVNIAEVDWPLCTETWAWLVWGDERRERTLRLAEYIRTCIDPHDFLRFVEFEQTTLLGDRLRALDLPVLVLNHPRFARMAPEAHNARVALAIPGAVVHSIASTDDRVAAIRAFVAGRPLPSAVSVKTVGAGVGASPLSARELEVLKLMAEGLTNAAIADRLTVSARTIDAHVRNIFTKTDSHGRAGAVAYAIRNQLL